MDCARIYEDGWQLPGRASPEAGMSGTGTERMGDVLRMLRAKRSKRQAWSVPWKELRIVDNRLELRRRFPSWGPKKLEVVLQREHPTMKVPARSTLSAILKRYGLVEERRPRRRTVVCTQPLAAATAPNVVWCTDFKGKFRVQRRYCHPLTISDANSRYLLRCEPLDGERLEASKAVFESLSRVRAAASHAQRQRDAIRIDERRRPVTSERVVD